MGITLWKDKTKKLIDPNLFSEKAEEIAKEIKAQATPRINKLTQIRKFYDEVLIIDNQIKSDPSNFEKILPYIKMINAKAAYAQGRDLISSGFKELITQALKQIECKDDFDVFKNFFEAFMGFYKYYYEKKSN